jgi:hypothetical protein
MLMTKIVPKARMSLLLALTLVLTCTGCAQYASLAVPMPKDPCPIRLSGSCYDPRDWSGKSDQALAAYKAKQIK